MYDSFDLGKPVRYTFTLFHLQIRVPTRALTILDKLFVCPLLQRIFKLWLFVDRLLKWNSVSCKSCSLDKNKSNQNTTSNQRVPKSSKVPRVRSLITTPETRFTFGWPNVSASKNVFLSTWWHGRVHVPCGKTSKHMMLYGTSIPSAVHRLVSLPAIP